jgi:hypothetical protein
LASTHGASGLFAKSSAEGAIFALQRLVHQTGFRPWVVRAHGFVVEQRTSGLRVKIRDLILVRICAVKLLCNSIGGGDGVRLTVVDNFRCVHELLGKEAIFSSR